MIQVTFRAAREADRKTYNWRRYGINQLRPTVVTVRGADQYDRRTTFIALVLEDDQVVFQNGSPGIAELIRANRRVIAAIVKGLQGDDAEQREERRRAAIFSSLRGD